jgi:hypothetical protein
MSSEGSENQEEVPVVVPEEAGKTIFINHLNSYMGKTLLSQLRNDSEVKEEYAAHTFNGTLKTDEADGSGKSGEAPSGASKVVSFERTQDFREFILNSDVLVYDLMGTQYEEVDYVIKTL